MADGAQKSAQPIPEALSLREADYWLYTPDQIEWQKLHSATLKPFLLLPTETKIPGRNGQKK